VVFIESVVTWFGRRGLSSEDMENKQTDPMMQSLWR